MSKTLSLNGDWELTYTTPGKPEEAWGRWIPAVVPGDVHLDLKRAELIAEPLVGDNSKKYHWIEEKDWWYRKTFEVDEAFLGQRLKLVCEGLDLTADVYLNNQKVGSANNMFIGHRFDVTKFLKAGENELCIRLDVGFEAVKGKPVEKFNRAWGRQEPRRPWMRKAQQTFYWDTAPRLVTCGIWRDVYLESHDSLILYDVYVSSRFDATLAKLYAQVELESLLEQRSNYALEITVYDGADEQTKIVPLSLTGGINVTRVALDIPNPKLWWPNGLGAQQPLRRERQRARRKQPQNIRRENRQTRYPHDYH